MSEPAGGMTVIDHLRELRSRIIRSILAVAAGMTGLLVWYDPMKNLLTKPYVNLCAANPAFGCDGSLYSLGPLDGFSARVRISAYGGIVLALPVILWQIWRFIVPALEKREKRYAVPFILSSVVLFAVGCVLAYWTLDRTLEFLITWAGEDVNQAFQVTKYMNLVVLMMLSFGVGFLSPVLIVFLQLVGVVRPQTLLRQWRYAVLSIFVVSAVITPDGSPVSLLVLAPPLTLLYMLAVLIGWLLVRKRPAA